MVNASGILPAATDFRSSQSVEWEAKLIDVVFLPWVFVLSFFHPTSPGNQVLLHTLTIQKVEVNPLNAYKIL